MRKVTEIIVHHSAETDTPELNWQGIRKYHMTPASQGGPPGGPWRDIGYHAGVELVGGRYEILMGRDWEWVGAHCPGHNTISLGLCFVGNFQEHVPPDDQLRLGARMIRTWMRLYNIPLENVYPHRDFNDTDCPGKMFPMDKLRGFISELP
jgi:hypothetical protein